MTDPKHLWGTWELVSFITQFEDGSTMLPYGDNAEGRIHYSEGGFMTAHLWDPDRHVAGALGARNDPAYFSYCGTFRVEGDQVIHTVAAATASSWTGKDRLRTMEMKGDDIELIAEGVVFEGKVGRGVLRWRRA
jgi:hypothetical protein